MDATCTRHAEILSTNTTYYDIPADTVSAAQREATKAARAGSNASAGCSVGLGLRAAVVRSARGVGLPGRSVVEVQGT